MELIPAIDLLDGNCVRLFQGDFEKCQVYDLEPADIARQYARAGAAWLHVVDLAASRDGSAVDLRPLVSLLNAAPQNVQTGGGIRKEEDIDLRLESGASRVVIGSVAAEAPDRFASWLDRYGSDALVSALDVQIDKAGVPQVRCHGWTQASGQTLPGLLDLLVPRGLRHVLITDISRDGAMSGPNLDLYAAIVRDYPELQVQASGGIRDVADLQALARIGVASAISGKALLDGTYTIEAALEALENL